MTTRSIERMAAVLAVALGMAGCSEVTTRPKDDSSSIGFEVLGSAGGGNAAAVIRPVGPDVVGLQGVLRFDPKAARYLGQSLADRGIMLVGESEISVGLISFAAIDRAGIGALHFVFAPIGAAGDLRLTLEISRAGNLAGERLLRHQGRFHATAGAGPVPTDPARLTVDDWFRRFPSIRSDSGLQPFPGQGTVYGDVNLNGFVNLFDVIAILNIAAGTQPLLTDLSRDAVIAGDVAPANAPGLGEFDDPIPPGLDASGNHVIDVFDGIAIGNAAAGVAEPVAGQPVPGRTVVGSRAVLSGQILTDRILARDTIYELDGMVIVTNGATLTIPAGTRIEGNTATRGALSIRRGSKIQVNGTRLEPVVMTCTAATKTSGCWGGLQINGAAPVNHTDFPGVIGCPELVAPGGFGIFGGCVPSATSGGLRYLRIEYAGAPSAGLAIAGLQLLGVGSGTVIENLQIHRSLDTGVLIGGGAAQLRNLFVTDNGGVGIDWNDGWLGKAQQVVVHRGLTPGIGMRGSNAPPNVTVLGQRSMPVLYNVTLIGPSAPGSGSPGLFLHQGTGGMIRDLIVQGFDGPGLEIDDSATCSALGSSELSLGYGLFFQNTPDFSTDVDCVDEVAYAGLPAQALMVGDPQLIAPYFSGSPDLRPHFGSPAQAGTPPPADGFFDPSFDVLGGVAAGNVTSSSIPWYAGWAIGW